MILCDLTTCYSYKGACFQHLKLKCDEPLSNFAFKFNSRRYTQDPTVATVYQDATVAHARYILRDIAGNPGVLTSGLQAGAYTRSHYSSTGAPPGHIHDSSRVTW